MQGEAVSTSIDEIAMSHDETGDLLIGLVDAADDYMDPEEVYFNAGDIVTIRYYNDLERNFDPPLENDGLALRVMPFGFAHEMAKYCGRKAKIMLVTDTKTGFKEYELDIDGGAFSWSYNMFKEGKKDRRI
jgi:hypothetical protein